MLLFLSLTLLRKRTIITIKYIGEVKVMSKRTYELDMAKGPILRNIILFTMPLIAGNILQLLYNAADMIVVSRWSGSNAMASVGAAAIAGCAAGGNIEGFVYTAMNAFHAATLTAVSQNYGAKEEKRIYKSIITSVCCVTVIGFALGLLTVIFALPFYRSIGMLFLCWPISWFMAIGMHTLRFVMVRKKAMAKMDET